MTELRCSCGKLLAKSKDFKGIIVLYCKRCKKEKVFKSEVLVGR